MIKIFIAEDDEDDLDFFRIALSEIAPNAEVIAAGDGMVLLEKLEKEKLPLPDLIFLDINMPKKNGFECIKEIRSNPALNNVPIIILSTSSDEKEIDLMYEKGASCYIKKPYDFKLYKKILKNLIENPCPVKDRPKDTFFINPDI